MGKERRFTERRRSGGQRFDERKAENEVGYGMKQRKTT